jgi:hypothetical protein
MVASIAKCFCIIYPFGLQLDNPIPSFFSNVPFNIVTCVNWNFFGPKWEHTFFNP